MSEKEAIENAVDTEVVDEVVNPAEEKTDVAEESATIINEDVDYTNKSEEIVEDEPSDVERASGDTDERTCAVEMSDTQSHDETKETSSETDPSEIIEEKVSESTNVPNGEVDEDDDEEEDEEAEAENIVKKPKKTKFEIQRQIKRITTNVVAVIIWIIGILLLLMCASNLYQQVFNPGGYTGFFGVGEAVVASKSMEPMLYENDLIFYNAVDVEDIDVGDVVVYKKTNAATDETILIVHEVQQISDGYCVTKGINNAVEDEAFSTSAIVGRYMFKVNQAGKLLGLLTTIWAPILIILIMLVAFAARIVYYMIYKKKTIEKISINEDTRLAIDHFFEI